MSVIFLCVCDYNIVTIKKSHGLRWFLWNGINCFDMRRHNELHAPAVTGDGNETDRHRYFYKQFTVLIISCCALNSKIISFYTKSFRLKFNLCVLFFKFHFKNLYKCDPVIHTYSLAYSNMIPYPLITGAS